ncbi:MAG: D-alanyl-D-alanine carboxypeptidase [Pseudomonadota bacterium]
MRTVIGSTASRWLRGSVSVFVCLVLVAAAQVVAMDNADAKKRKSYKRAKAAKAVASNPRYAAFVIDAKTGKTLFARNADKQRYPASLTKMMTLYLMFEDLKSGRIKKSDRVVMTRAGARRPPSKIGLRVGRSISVEQAILALVTKSANDVATAVGDKLSGSEAAFARRMTRKARQLGMKRTTFKNASGLTQRGQTTTARDMSKLGIALREHFPRRFKYFKTRLFKLGKARYGNHNRLLGRVRGVDGIKTGYTRASGFNLVSSVRTGGRSIVAVVMGGRTGGRRNAHMTSLIRRTLPKASRGKKKLLIARATSSRTKSARKAANKKLTTRKVAKAIKQIKVAPKPAFSPKTKGRIANRIALAHAATASARVSKAEIASVRSALRKMAARNRPTPQARPATRSNLMAFSADQKTTASIKAVELITRPETNTKPKPAPGWHVQIAATDSKAKALEMLKSVRRSNQSILRGRSLHVPTVNKNGTTLFRARYTGFSSKRQARRACNALKKRRIKCIALKS